VGVPILVFVDSLATLLGRTRESGERTVSILVFLDSFATRDTGNQIPYRRSHKVSILVFLDYFAT